MTIPPEALDAIAYAAVVVGANLGVIIFGMCAFCTSMQAELKEANEEQDKGTK
jgi:hypothetical protein